jgi:N-acetylmuramoyl-L-alanine amidase
MADKLPADFVAALTEPQILTVTLWGETRGEPIEGQIAVGCVIRNRVNADLGNDNKPDWWGEGYAGVCLKPWQFSCWIPQGGRENYELVMATAKTIATSTRLPDDLMLRQCAWVAQGIIVGWIQDTVKGATQYYNPKAMVPRGRVPDWAMNKTPVVVKGDHQFFAGAR